MRLVWSLFILKVTCQPSDRRPPATCSPPFLLFCAFMVQLSGSGEDRGDHVIAKRLLEQVEKRALTDKGGRDVSPHDEM